MNKKLWRIFDLSVLVLLGAAAVFFLQPANILVGAGDTLVSLKFVFLLAAILVYLVWFYAVKTLAFRRLTLCPAARGAVWCYRKAAALCKRLFGRATAEVVEVEEDITDADQEEYAELIEETEAVAVQEEGSGRSDETALEAEAETVAEIIDEEETVPEEGSGQPSETALEAEDEIVAEIIDEEEEAIPEGPAEDRAAQPALHEKKRQTKAEAEAAGPEEKRAGTAAKEAASEKKTAAKPKTAAQKKESGRERAGGKDAAQAGKKGPGDRKKKTASSKSPNVEAAAGNEAKEDAK